MKLRSLLLLGVGAGLFLPQSTAAQSILEKQLRTRVSSYSGNALRVAHFHSDHTPHLILGDPKRLPIIFDPASSRDSISKSLSSFATDFYGKALGLDSGYGITINTATRRGILWQSVVSMSYHGIPLLDRHATLIAGAKSGKVMSVENELPLLAPLSDVPRMSGSQSDSIALAYDIAAGNKSSIATSSHLAFAMVGGPRPKLIYEVVARSSTSLNRFRIDAVSGKIVGIKDLFEYLYDSPASGNDPTGRLTALVHPSTPFDSLIAVPLERTNMTIGGMLLQTDTTGHWHSSSALSPYQIVTRFSSLYYQTQDTAQEGHNSILNVSVFGDTSLEWTDSNSNAAERDAYYHIGLIESYMRSYDSNLALNGLDKMLTVNVNVDAICNARYDPTAISVNFYKAGGGCSNTGEIADIVFHEFGHRVADVRYTETTGNNISNGSLSEGFADLVSAFMRDDPRIGIGFTGPGTILRTCDNTRTWPQDINPDIHISGEIVAGAIWDLRKLIGHDTAERLFNEMEYLHPDGVDQTSSDALRDAFVNVLNAIATADDDNNDLTDGTPHINQILQAFAKHGINLSSTFEIESLPLPNQDSTSPGYPVLATAIYLGGIGAIDTTGVFVHYTTDHWATTHNLQMQTFGNDTFTCTIPRVAAGTLVEYYISAGASFAEIGLAYEPTDAPGAWFSFLVGYKSVYLEDAEHPAGWSLGLPSDKATAGLWTRDVPYGTYLYPGDFVQQDTDHTPNGTMCYLTGNLNAAVLSRDITYDDVDNGSTTLTTPVYDLSKMNAPAIRVWYYYSNKAGSNPEVNTWKVLLSSDSGSTWKYLVDTRQSTEGWQSLVFRVSDYVTPSRTIMLRFIASDTVGAIVEAGVDDLEIFTALSGEAVVNSTSPSELLEISEPYPNPSRSGLVSHVILSTPSSDHLLLQIKNILGTTVLTPLDRYLLAGTYVLPIELGSLPTGIYWLELSSPSGERIRKVTVAR